MDKPAGPTSQDAVTVIRRALHARRAGHAGTLDPFATGLLVVLLGAGTRLARYVTAHTKQYAGVIRLGQTTDTDDATGTPGLATQAWRSLSDDDIGCAMRALTGPQAQRPPTFSAKRVGGERAYQRARRGQEVHLAPVTVDVHHFSLVAREGPDVWFNADVTSGTYIRSLARDLGARLGCGAYLATLRRLTIGPFQVEDAVGLTTDTAMLMASLRPLRDAVQHLPAVPVDEAGEAALRHGQAVPLSDLLQDGTVAVVSAAAGGLLAVAEARGGRAWPRVVLES